LLILDGPPAAGKNSLAKAIAHELQAQAIPQAVIEMDDLARI
jgi:cytidylate kinase